MRVSYSDGYFVPLPPKHPFPMGKFPALRDKLVEEGLLREDDIVAPPAVSRYLDDRLPDTTLRMLDAAGHCPHMSHPDATVRAMEEYSPIGARLS